MVTSAEQTEKSIALATFIKLMRATESVSSDVHRELSAAGLSISQFGILEALHHRGTMSQKQLAAKILKSAGNITMVINNLEKRGLATRERCAEDKRSCLVSLTPRGKKLIADIFPAHAERIRERMTRLTTKEQKLLGDLLRKLGQSSRSKQAEQLPVTPNLNISWKNN